MTGSGDRQVELDKADSIQEEQLGGEIDGHCFLIDKVRYSFIGK